VDRRRPPGHALRQQRKSLHHADGREGPRLHRRDDAKTGADKLKSLDTARYGAVDLTSDTLSYDVFSQAAQAVRTHPELLGGRAPAVVLGTGHSQSALRLTTYANAVQPVRGVQDGLLIHGRAALAGNSGGNVAGACLPLGTTTPLSAVRIRQLLPRPRRVRREVHGVARAQAAPIP
jgi:hypothetical protein